MIPLLKKWIRAVAERDFSAPKTLLIGGVPGVGKSFDMKVMGRWIRWQNRHNKTLQPGMIGYVPIRTLEVDSYLFGGFNLVDTFTRAARNDYDSPDFRDFKADCEQLRRADLLLIDDVGGERNPPPSFEPGLRSLLNQRTDAGLFTAMTCNLTAAEIKERLGDRTFSRVMLGGAVVILTGKDRRKEMNSGEYSNWSQK